MTAAVARSDAAGAVSIEVKDLSKFYGDFKALDKVSFTIRAGEIVGFLGPNGAGKTTTMKILTCFMGATSGAAKVSGFDVADQSMEVRRRVGYLPETVPLYKDMIVYDYLAFIAEMRGVPGDKIHSAIADTAKVCGLPEMINRPIRELSKGYRQRVGLAQALIHKPEVVILDEPTSGLDPNQLVEIRDLIKEIGKEKTIIFSTHILQEVAAVCDRILIINKGKLIADGTVEELENKVRREQHTIVTLASAGGGGLDVDAIGKELKNVGRVHSVDHLQTESGEATFLVIAERGADLRHDIFRLAEEKGLILLELQGERLTLEDIFRSLTGDAAQVAADKRAKAIEARRRTGSDKGEAPKKTTPKPKAEPEPEDKDAVVESGGDSDDQAKEDA